MTERLDAMMEAHIRAWAEGQGRPKRRMRWSIPLLLAEIDALRTERRTTHAAIHEVWWMGRRYADGRRSYATSLYNDRTRRLLAAGVAIDQPDGTPWARDADGPAYGHLSADEHDRGRPPESWGTTDREPVCRLRKERD